MKLIVEYFTWIAAATIEEQGMILNILFNRTTKHKRWRTYIHKQKILGEDLPGVYRW